MEEFILILRNEKRLDEDQDQGKNETNIKNWQNWLAGIIAEDKYITGYKLGNNGKSLTEDNQVISGPYAEKNEILIGFFVVKAESFEDAFELVKDCPILEEGGKVEVRNTLGGS